ncbi:NACHT domain-containing protein [Actinoplanes sp. CA-015351]|uniref:NACHT domain-containing protein n=1 Tax=Actinoplanes sp. CA-015351 TaxID=3239897 RepID=UPI003D958358
MGRLPKSILQASVVALVGLVLIPTAVNIGTGGEAPGFLMPYVGLLWPAVLVLCAVAIGVEVWSRTTKTAQPESARPDADVRNERNAFDQVGRYIAERRSESLVTRVRIRLVLDERRDAVLPLPHVVERVGSMPPTSDILAAFESLQQDLLLLGVPGIGKSTMMLKLAGDLISRGGSVPVLLDLADWSVSGRRRTLLGGYRDLPPRPLAEWVAAAAYRRYRLPVAVTRAWLRQGRIILLLDGLDEVRADRRDRCAQEINALRAEFPLVHVVVSCREQEYAGLGTRLRMMGAVAIKPLTRQQVLDFVAVAGPRMDGVAAALRADPQLWELADTPLILNVMAVAETEDWAAGGDGLAERRARLFGSYVSELLRRRIPVGRSWSPRRAREVLRFLARSSAILESETRVSWPSHRTWLAVLPPEAAWLLANRFVPFLTAGLLGGFTFALTLDHGVWAALCIAVSGLGWTSFILDRCAVRPQRRMPLRGTTAAAAGLVPGIVAGFAALYAGLGFAEVLVHPLGNWVTFPLMALLPLVLPLAAVGQYAKPGRRFRLGMAMWFFGIVILAVLYTLLLDGPHLLVDMWCAGLLLGVLLNMPFTAMMLDSSNPAASRTPQTGLRRAVMAASPVAAILALATGAPVEGPVITTVVGLLWGQVSGLTPAILVADSLTTPVSRAAMLLAGRPLPTARRFLPFAAACGLLARTDDGYFFGHLLIRDHLADEETLS